MRLFALLCISLLSLTQAFAASPFHIEDAWVKTAYPGAKNGAAYFCIKNPTKSADRLIEARFRGAKKVELHTHIMTNGVMRMRHIRGGLELPAKGALLLQPMGNHIMLMGLKRPLKIGDELVLELIFERAGALEINFDVEDRKSAPSPCGAPMKKHGHHHDHHHDHH